MDCQHVCGDRPRALFIHSSHNIILFLATINATFLGVTTGLCSTVGNVSDCRYVSDCRSKGHEFDPGAVPYFCGDWNNFYCHFPCLATDACLTADPGVASSIPARSHTFVEIDHEIISTVILLPSADSFKKGCCQLQAKVCTQITG